MIRIPFFNNISERAKAIIFEAEALVEQHGKDAYGIAHDFERNANSLGAAFYWRAVGKVVSARIEKRVDLLPPTRRVGNCTACLVERISGTLESEGLPAPLACVSCIAERFGRRLGRQQELSREGGNCTTCLVERAAGTYEGGGLPVPLACVSCVAEGLGRTLQTPRQASPIVIDHDAGGMDGVSH